jgi:molybdate transport system substrate-binding protein
MVMMKTMAQSDTRDRHIVGSSTARATEINVMISAAFNAAYRALAPQFERVSGRKVATTEAHWDEMMVRLRGGETADLVIMADFSIDALIKDGLVMPGSRTDLASSGVGVAVRAGAPKPDIGSAEALKETLLAAKSIAYSIGPSGRYVATLLQRLGIADALKPKLQQIKGEYVGVIVARGDAEIGFQQVSELLPIPGTDFVGPLPPDIQHVTVFSAGLHVDAKGPERALELVAFLTAPAAASAIRRAGMEPR